MSNTGSDRQSDRLPKSSSRASSNHTDGLPKVTSSHPTEPTESASEAVSVHSERSSEMSLNVYDVWEPGGVRAYTDEERLEGEQIMDWMLSVTRGNGREVEMGGWLGTVKDYLEPSMVANEFVEFDMYAVTEIWNLENEVTTTALEARDPQLQITIEDLNLNGAGHKLWASIDHAYISSMDEGEKRRALNLAKADSLFLRTQIVELQRLVHKRKQVLKYGGILEMFSYLRTPRPAENEDFYIDELEHAANETSKHNPQERTSRSEGRYLNFCLDSV